MFAYRDGEPDETEGRWQTGKFGDIALYSEILCRLPGTRAAVEVDVYRFVLANIIFE